MNRIKDTRIFGQIYLKMLKSPACIGKISAPQQGFTVKRKCVASKIAQVLSQQEQSDSN